MNRVCCRRRLAAQSSAVVAWTARRAYLESSLFEFDQEDREAVAKALEARVASVTPSSAATTVGADDPPTDTVRVAAEKAKIWANDAKLRENANAHAANIGTQVSDADFAGASSSAGLLSAKEVSQELLKRLKQQLPEGYAERVDDIVKGAHAKRSGEKLQERLMQKHAARLDIDTARAAVADAHSRVLQKLQEEPRRGDRPDFGSTAYQQWEREYEALKSAKRDAEAREIVVRECMALMERRLHRDTEKSGVYELAAMAGKYTYTAASVAIVALFQLAMGMVYAYRYWRGTTPNQRLRHITERVDALASSPVVAVADDEARVVPTSDVATETATATTAVARLEGRVETLEAALARAAEREEHLIAVMKNVEARLAEDRVGSAWLAAWRRSFGYHVARPAA